MRSGMSASTVARRVRLHDVQPTVGALDADVAEDRFGRDSEVARDLGFVIARGLDDVHLVEAETLLDLFLEAGVDVYGYSDHGSNGLPRPRAGGWGCDDQLEEH